MDKKLMQLMAWAARQGEDAKEASYQVCLMVSYMLQIREMVDKTPALAGKMLLVTQQFMMRETPLIEDLQALNADLAEIVADAL